MVSVIGDWTISNDVNVPNKKTYVKILFVPDMYKQYVKNKVPEKDSFEIGDYMIIVKDVRDSHIGKIKSDMISVDNLLANTLNQCIGSGCKEGIISQPFVLEKNIEITNNIQKKEILNQMKKQKGLAEAKKPEENPKEKPEENPKENQKEKQEENQKENPKEKQEENQKENQKEKSQ